ncbi:MAG: hypothetical protein HYZ92_00590 [Candidatus Omnitrophica bacterium]|nr:hypothetical protein [Candidatus Omnitrophota bacterium]
MSVALGLWPWAGPVHAGSSGSPRVEVRGEWLYVDGEPFLVKGVGYSPFRPGQAPWNSSVGLDVMAADFAKIRQAGFNTIRTWSALTPEQLALAREHQLMVLQGIWVDPKAPFTSDGFESMLLQVVGREVERSRRSDNVLALLVGNELSPERVYEAGLPEVEGTLRHVTALVRDRDPARLVSYANWPQLSLLDHSMWDLICFNLYPYAPASVSHSFGFRGYLEHLKHTVARGKPLVVTEVGVSASPKPGIREGLGGYTPEAQAQEALRLWDAVFQAGAQGACVFEWNDEWWKQSDRQGDEQTHDEDDPEEWFGLMMFSSKEQAEPTPRPLYHAMKAYNQAVLISPISQETYDDRLPVAVYATDEVGSVRFRLGWERWKAAAKVSPHWWKARLPLPPSRKAKQVKFVLEARGRNGRLLTQRERLIWLGGAQPPVQVTIQTDRDAYEVNHELESMQYVITVTDAQGRPVAGQPVNFAITEPKEGSELTHAKQTNAQGRIEGTYLVGEPGVMMLSAGTAFDSKRPDRRTGAERVVLARRKPAPVLKPAFVQPAHQPSVWEAQVPSEIRRALMHPAPAFELFDPGSEPVVDYNKYGRFEQVGTAAYHYEITDRSGLSAAVGEGIYPNEDSLSRDPDYGRTLRGGKLEGKIWDFIYHDDIRLAFYRWAGADEETPGVRQFFTALQFERAGLLQSAVKAYDAILVHFPDAVGWTEFQTPWYVGVVAVDRIEAILRLHPELGLRLEGAKVQVRNGFDNEPDNDVVITWPGSLARVEPGAANPPSIDVASLGAKREIGKGRVRLRQFANGHWQLLVDGRPWVIRGISYQPSQVGESPDEGTLKDWMTADRNQNGKPDGPFDTFVDENRNNQQDPDEPAVGDFELMRRLGANTMRLYHHASNKALLRQLYDQYGIMVLMGDLVGMYTVGSGAKWEEGTNYLDPTQRKRMTESVRQMVKEFKNEPYVLMWVLGNENNYGGVHGIVGGRGNAAWHPKEYYAFLNELAQWIHKEDPNHPVAIANGEFQFIDLIAQHAPAIDVFGANVYRGWHGSGRSFFQAVRDQLDKPVFITEFGAPAYIAGHSLEEGELGQALYHFGNWVDLEDNMAGRGVGNALGGVVFAWVDEWWKAGQPPRFSPRAHDTTPNWSGPFPGGKNYEEWFGITSQGAGSLSPYLRQLRSAYFLYQKLWNRNSP